MGHIDVHVSPLTAAGSLLSFQDASSLEMKPKWINRIWIAGWVLFALSHLLLPVGYYGSGETDTTMRQLSAAMLWGWFGILPLIALSLISPVLTLVWWKDLSRGLRIKGILLPAFLVLGCVTTSFVMDVVINI
jgi:hypothetical protein